MPMKQGDGLYVLSELPKRKPPNRVDVGASSLGYFMEILARGLRRRWKLFKDRSLSPVGGFLN
jgi:hypothetical protein